MPRNYYFLEIDNFYNFYKSLYLKHATKETIHAIDLYYYIRFFHQF